MSPRARCRGPSANKPSVVSGGWGVVSGAAAGFGLRSRPAQAEACGHPTPHSRPTNHHGGSMAGSKRDYYEILGVERDAGDEELKRAYRELAKKHHPDRNGGDPDAASRFQEVDEAYKVLADPEKRQRYDRYGH